MAVSPGFQSQGTGLCCFTICSGQTSNELRLQPLKILPSTGHVGDLWDAQL